jgi:hypothetical protein
MQKVFQIRNLKTSNNGGYFEKHSAQTKSLRIMALRGSKKTALSFPCGHVKTKPPFFNT